MKFIHLHWKNDHILSKNRSLFNWQYQGSDQQINFILAKEKNEVLGILGYIKNSKYDEELMTKDVVWLALWKVKDNTPSGLGLNLYKELLRKEQGSIIAVNGINETHPPIYRALGFQNVEFDCFYMVNSEISQNIIKHNCQLPKSQPIDQKGVSLKEIDIHEIQKIDNLVFQDNNLNHKSVSYFSNKYLLHPFYKYRIFSILDKKKCLGLLCTRIVTYKDYKALRVIDFIGEQKSISRIGKSILELIKIEGIEYVDFWQHGLQERYLLEAGFYKLDFQKNDIVIPNFFEPFVQKSIKIFSAVRLENTQNFFFFKGDGDQDRPTNLDEPYE